MVRGKVKPAKVNLKKNKGESNGSYKNRVADAQRRAYREAAQKNAAIDAEIARQAARNRKSRPVLDTEGPKRGKPDPPAKYVTVKRGIFGRRSTGHHD
jgi:hypothetical protein